MYGDGCPYAHNVYGERIAAQVLMQHRHCICADAEGRHAAGCGASSKEDGLPHNCNICTLHGDNCPYAHNVCGEGECKGSDGFSGFRAFGVWG